AYERSNNSPCGHSGAGASAPRRRRSQSALYRLTSPTAVRSPKRNGPAAAPGPATKPSAKRSATATGSPPTAWTWSAGASGVRNAHQRDIVPSAEVTAVVPGVVGPIAEVGRPAAGARGSRLLSERLPPQLFFLRRRQHVRRHDQAAEHRP